MMRTNKHIKSHVGTSQRSINFVSGRLNERCHNPPFEQTKSDKNFDPWARCISTNSRFLKKFTAVNFTLTSG